MAPQSPIDYIIIPDVGLDLKESTTKVKKWANEGESTRIALNFHAYPLNMMPLVNLDSIIAFQRNIIQMSGGGLIEVSKIKIKGVDAIKFICKIPDPTTGGVSYSGGIVIPLQRCGYSIEIRSTEVGTTGIREAVVMDKMLADGTMTFSANDMAGWMSDPYDSTTKKGLLMNKAEDKKYDERFPDHPLSRVRKIMAQFESDISFFPEFDKLQQQGSK